MNFDPRMGRSGLQHFSRHLLASAAVVALVLGQAANANPTGHAVASGTATFTTPATGTLQVKQTSNIVIINWSSFNIAAGQTTKFVQPATTSVAVNRIGGSSPSSILGSLLANGRVVLINGNGIVFGTGSKVNVGSLIATASDAADANLATGKATFSTAGKPNAQVINQGTITAASGGLVGLIAPAVSNSGVITATLGTVTLGASNIFTLDFTGDGLVSFPVAGNIAAVAVKNGVPVAALVVDSGKITGGTVMLTARAAASLVTNVISMKGTVVATSASQVGGKIVLDGGSSGNIAVSGKLIADGTSGGSVSVVSKGTTTATGTLTAKNTATTGKGGAITTKGKSLTVGGTIAAGNGGSWLLDASNLTLNSTAVTLVDTALAAGTNTTVQIESGGTTSGDLTLATPFSWSGSGSLTLNAYRNLTINTGVTIANTGKGSLALHADNGAKGSGKVAFNGTGKVDWSASTGGVNVFYHPSSYASPTSFSSHVTLHSGSKLTAYMAVDTATDLQNIAKNLNGVYALNANISASGLTSFLPIGLDNYGQVGNSLKGFNGIFDGQNHTIDKLTITTSFAALDTPELVGLFGYISSDAIVRNVGVTNITVNDKAGYANNVGTLVGENHGKIVNAYATGNLQTGNQGGYIGGLVGFSLGTITSSHASVKVTDTGTEYGGLYIGGLAGFNSGTISGSYATGAVTAGLDGGFGGLVGWNHGGKISNSHATGAVTAKADFSSVGGLVGDNDNSLPGPGATIISSYATGKVTGGDESMIGGLVGGNFQSAIVASSYATGAVIGGDYSTIGGLVGTDNGIDRITISSSYAKGNVSGGSNSKVGGLVGDNSVGTILNSHAYGAVTGGSGSYIGGLVGGNGGSISGCSAAQSPLVGTNYDGLGTISC
jgi:filamentous hemagglutinin family protein